MRKRLGALIVLPLITLLGCDDAPSRPGSDLRSFQAQVEGTRATHGLPGLAVAVVRTNHQLLAVSGLRDLDADSSFALRQEDLFFLGENTRVLTATALANALAGQDTLLFQPLREVGEATGESLHVAWGDVTAADLLRHRGGLAPLLLPGDWSGLPLGDLSTQRADRLALARSLLSRPPVHPIGEYLFSNAGIVVVTALYEQLSGGSWYGDLIEAALLTPMRAHGHPGHPADVYDAEPHGHVRVNGGWRSLREDEAPYPRALDPARGYCLSLEDCAAFLETELLLLEGHGGNAARLRHATLHAREGEDGLGWGRATIGGRATSLLAASSDGFSSFLALQPGHDWACVILSNASGDGAIEAISTLADALLARDGAPDPEDLARIEQAFVTGGR